MLYMTRSVNRMYVAGEWFYHSVSQYETTGFCILLCFRIKKKYYALSFNFRTVNIRESFTDFTIP